MDIEDVLEVFKISMVEGEINNAYNIIHKNMELYHKKHEFNNENFMNLLIKGMENEISPDELYGTLTDKKYNVFKFIENYDEYIKSLTEVIRYSLNRYDINYPYFDSKRCNDL